MKHLPHPISLTLLAVVLATPVSAQAGVIVDPVNGPYRTITAALAATTGTDIIRVKKGIYTETLRLDGRAANIVSIAASPGDVVLRGATPASPALTIRNHPAGQTSRFARLVIDNGQPSTQATDGVATDISAGHIVFEECQSTSRWSLRNHRGTISLTRCVIRPLREGNYQLLIDGVERAFLHQCTLAPQYRNSIWIASVIYPGTVINKSNVELCCCSLRGSDYGSYLIRYTEGGPALDATDSTCRITGVGADAIVGGSGHITSIAHRKTAGGSGIVATRSTLTIAKVQVKAGPGVNLFNQPAPDIANTASTVTRPATMPPVVQNTRGFTRGRVETITLFGPGSANALTWIALDFAPFQTPFGYLLVDPGGPVMTLPATLSRLGVATHTLDLRTLPATFTGAPYLMQSITLAPNNTVGLSSPQNGVIASR